MLGLRKHPFFKVLPKQHAQKTKVCTLTSAYRLWAFASVGLRDVFFIKSPAMLRGRLLVLSRSRRLMKKRRWWR
ncbi:hypothetical protein BaRGS_00008127 [Batillaria attramentaria]|uniref:Uncharacterized protein n=1 Tax=Batillaria attramentaria TaxID=370345 RepID=A0ABD0LLU9_9CAEN